MLKRLKQLKYDYDAVFSSPEGKRVLADLAKRHGVFEAAFVPGDPQHTAFRDGKRSVVVDLLRYLNVNISELQQLEKVNERTSDDE